MHLAHLPFVILPTHQARNALGASLGKAAVLALRAILAHRKSLEVAHQQIRYGIISRFPRVWAAAAI